MRGVLYSWIVVPLLGLQWGLDLQPSALFRFDFSRSGGTNVVAQPGGAFGVRLDVNSDLQGIALDASGAFWAQNSLQAALLEAYAAAPLADFELSVGKRTLYAGPWDQTLMGLEGQWGLFIRYNPYQQLVDWLPPDGLGLEVAYLPLTSGYLGARVGPVRLGSLLGVRKSQRYNVVLGDYEDELALYPRVGLDLTPVNLFWQSDRGFWATSTIPLRPIVEAVLPPSDPGLQTLFSELEQSRLEFLTWWSPDWEYLFPTVPLAQADAASFFSKPKKLLLSAWGSWRDQIKLGFDASIAPAEAYRLWLEFWVRE